MRKHQIRLSGNPILLIRKNHLLVSGNANNGSNARLGYFNSNEDVGNANANTRFRSYCVKIFLFPMWGRNLLTLPLGKR